VPTATAAVPIIAWCSFPMDSARTSRSTIGRLDWPAAGSDIVGRFPNERHLGRVRPQCRVLHPLDSFATHQGFRSEEARALARIGFAS
jgi:hypothetical protein